MTQPAHHYHLSAALTLTSEQPLSPATVTALRSNMQAALQRSYDEGAITGDLDFDETYTLSVSAPSSDVTPLAHAENLGLLMAANRATVYLIRQGVVRYRVDDDEHQLCLRAMLQSVIGAAPVRLVDAEGLVQAEYRRQHPEDLELHEFYAADEDELFRAVVARDPAALYALPDAPREFER